MLRRNPNLDSKNHAGIRLCNGVLASILSIAAASEGLAQDNRQIPGYQRDAESRTDNDSDQAWSIVVGAGAAFGPLSEGGGDVEIIPFPVLNVTYRDKFYIDIADGIGVNLISTDTTLISVDANFASSRSDDDSEDSFLNDGDFERFAGLGDVDGDIAIELYASHIIFDVAELSVSATREFGNVKGWQVTGGLASGYEIADNLFIGAQATATWSDSSYSDAFYGVTTQQAQRRDAIAATNPLITPYDVFDAGSGLTDVTLGVGLFKTFGRSDQFFANLDVGYSFALGDLQNSPITEETSTPGGALTLGWQF